MIVNSQIWCWSRFFFLQIVTIHGIVLLGEGRRGERTSIWVLSTSIIVWKKVISKWHEMRTDLEEKLYQITEKVQWRMGKRFRTQKKYLWGIVRMKVIKDIYWLHPAMQFSFRMFLIRSGFWTCKISGRHFKHFSVNYFVPLSYYLYFNDTLLSPFVVLCPCQCMDVIIITIFNFGQKISQNKIVEY